MEDPIMVYSEQREGAPGDGYILQTEIGTGEWHGNKASDEKQANEEQVVLRIGERTDAWLDVKAFLLEVADVISVIWWQPRAPLGCLYSGTS